MANSFVVLRSISAIAWSLRNVASPPTTKARVLTMKRAGWVTVALVSFAVVIYASIFPIAELFTEVVVLRTYDAEGSPHDTRLTVILRTYDAEGSPHDTRLTVIDRAGTPWVRGRPYRGWFRRVEANPIVALYRGGVWRPVRASVSRDAADAAAFDQVMLETYGLTYRYVDLISRISSNEIPVRLVPRTP
jgi:hypothetical protein